MVELARFIHRGTVPRQEAIFPQIFVEPQSQLNSRIHAAPDQLCPFTPSHLTALPRTFNGWQWKAHDWRDRLGAADYTGPTIPIVYIRSDERWPVSFRKQGYLFWAFAVTEISDVADSAKNKLFQIISLRLLRSYRNNVLEPEKVTLAGKTIDFKNELDYGSFQKEGNGTIRFDIQAINLTHHFVALIDSLSLDNTVRSYQ